MTGEEAVLFDCHGDTLVGILHRPTIDPPERAMVLVVGGPQYRVGSHRQFVLLSRALAKRGIVVFRFDYRGMGDSSGHFAGFESVEADIESAIDETLTRVPELRKVALWGLCDAASAIAMYAGLDDRVDSVVLVNPWVRSVAGEAQVIVRNYYGKRVLDPRAWRLLASEPSRLFSAFRSVLGNVQRAFISLAPAIHTSTSGPYGLPDADLPERVFVGIQRYCGEIRIVLCEKDLTAQEFRLAAEHNVRYRKILRTANVSQVVVPDADHTFSRAVWRERIVELTSGWLLQ